MRHTLCNAMTAYCIGGTVVASKAYTDLEALTESAQKTLCQLRGSTNTPKVKGQVPDELSKHTSEDQELKEHCPGGAFTF